MKIIVCGAGSVGKSIVSYLTKGSNDVIVIDDNQRRLDELAQEFDVLPITGKPSHPDVLERAGAKDCDIILAVTESDEVNMIICQLAYSLFNISKKIAGVKSETFMDPLWGMLYNDNHLPIDLLISPDIDIAEHILKILQYPGSSGILPVWNKKYCILTLNINDNNPFAEMPLNQIAKQFDGGIGFINIIRNNVSFLPSMYDTIQSSDEINLLVKCNNIYNVISAFGLEKNTNERLVIFGGGAVAQYICSHIENDDVITSARLIEEDIDQARELARQFNRVVVINGEMMSDVILFEADITKADAAIAVTDNDKDNLLASMIASKDGVGTTISLINTPSYNNLMFNIADNTIVDRSAIAISHLLKEIRRSSIANAYSISRGQGEIWEIAVDDNNSCVAKKNGELGLPKTCRIIAVLRGDELLYPDLNFKLNTGDQLLVYVDSTQVKQAEDIFC
ncbi:MAG: Trk system potassium transporter TrkA [Alphaproteobacteria bacterium]|nr:Trk system potassium transporter TrkA [Alphaproteobacteria bacterium]